MSFILSIALFFAFLSTAFAQSGVTGKPFEVGNLFPGDSVTQEYTVTTAHNDPLPLTFGIAFPESWHQLAQALHIHVTLDGAATLYDGLLQDFPTTGITVDLPAGKNNAIYTVTATLPTSAGNEYQNREVTFDLLWWYPQDADTPSRPPEVDSADTGDRFPLPLYGSLSAAALCGIAALVLCRRKGGRHEP